MTNVNNQLSAQPSSLARRHSRGIYSAEIGGLAGGTAGMALGLLFATAITSARVGLALVIGGIMLCVPVGTFLALAKRQRAAQTALVSFSVLLAVFALGALAPPVVGLALVSFGVPLSGGVARWIVMMAATTGPDMTA